MNPRLTLLLMALLTTGPHPALAADPGPVIAAPEPVTVTLKIAGMECGGCVAMITQSISDVKGVTDIDLDIIGACGSITLDARLASAHQVAQAVADALPVHGKPFAASLGLKIPAYAAEGNRPRIDAVFARQKAWVEFEPVDAAKGEFAIRFHPLKAGADGKMPSGWNLEPFIRALRDPAPAGLGLAVELGWKRQVAETPAATPLRK